MKAWLACALALCGCDHLLGIGDLVEGDAGTPDAATGFGTPPGVMFGPAATSFFAGSIGQLALADVDGDGVPDLILQQKGSPTTISVFLNATAKNSQTIQFGSAITVISGPAPVFGVGDFNGDGKADLAVGDDDLASVDVFLSTTPVGALTASFAAKVTFPVADLPGQGPVVGDFNADGKPDVVTPGFDGTGTDGKVSVLVNNTTSGTAAFAAAQSSAVNQSQFVLVADLDGDGRDDLVVPFDSTNQEHSPDKTQILMNHSAGNVVQLTTATILPDVAVAIADLNGDHLPDLVMGDSAVQLNTSSAGTVGFTRVPLTEFFGSATVAVDINGDGTPDIVTPQGSGLQLLLNRYVQPGLPTIDFTVAEVMQLASGNATQITAIAVGDLNGDGKPDLVLGTFINGGGTTGDDGSTIVLLAR